MDASIIPECYADTCLIESLVPPKRRYNHTKGCPAVVGKMKVQFENAFAVGIIDKDKKELDYAKEFEMIAEVNGQLELMKHPERHHYLIYVCPAFERWVMLCAKEVGVSLSEFGVPGDFDGLKNYAKQQMDKEDIEYRSLKRLFQELMQKNSGAVMKLSRWIDYLKQNRYNVDIEYLKQL